MAGKPHAETTYNKGVLVATLMDAPVEHETGFATRALQELLAPKGCTWNSANVNDFVKTLVAEGAVKVEQRGRRTFKIELVTVPEWLEPEVERILAGGGPPGGMPAAPVEETVSEEPPAPEVQPIIPESVGPTADEVANAILNRVFEIHSRPARAEENTQRLREALDQREAAVRRAKDLAEDLQVAVRSVQSGREKITRLEGELAQVRENLRQAMAATKFAVDEQVQKEVAKLMKPSNGKVSV